MKGCQSHRLHTQKTYPFSHHHDIVLSANYRIYIGRDHGHHYHWGARLIRPLLHRLHTGGIKLTTHLVLYGTLDRRWSPMTVAKP